MRRGHDLDQAESSQEAQRTASTMRFEPALRRLIWMSSPLALLSVLHRAIDSQGGTRLGSISGVVIDSLVRHAPLAGAEVVIIEWGRTTVTNAAGQLRFDSVAPGSLRLTFYHAVLDS